MEPLTASWVTHSAQETRRLGAALGRVLQPGDFVALVGDLGAGKTEFARGAAEGCGVPADEVASPTFALVHRYHGRIPLVHADLYRLLDEDDLYGTGYFEMRDAGDAALLVEWAERIASATPADALTVRLESPPDEVAGRSICALARGPTAGRLLASWAATAGG
jgi:tRNA threonylcarbamoyladenosine biosynthesis protein TsaE